MPLEEPDTTLIEVSTDPARPKSYVHPVMHMRQSPLVRIAAEIPRRLRQVVLGRATILAALGMAGLGIPVRFNRSIVCLARLACIAPLIAGTAVSQGFIRLPLGEDGNPVLPASTVLEAAYSIDTIGGTGHEGYGGDGGPATEAIFYTPSGLIVDADGNVYVADRNNYRVRRIDASGTVSTTAGTGRQGTSGDGGLAADAQLASPSAIAQDADGNILVASSSGHRVRKIDTAGIVTTIAGTGEQGSSGDDGPAIEAQLNRPNAIAVDSEGNVYVAEYGSHRVRKINVAGVITAFAGNGVKGNGGDGGPATEAQLDFVNGLAVDAAGNVYIADMNQARVRKVDRSGEITTVAGTGIAGWSGDGGPATEAQITTPAGIAVDSQGNLFVAEYWVGRIRKVDPGGIMTTIAGISEQQSSGDMGLASRAGIDRPSAIAVDPAGNLYITEAFGHKIRILRPIAERSAFTLSLGSSGDEVVLTVAENGVVRIGDQPLLNGFEVTARDGQTYSISQSPDGVIAATQMPEQIVAVDDQGNNPLIPLVDIPDGAYIIDVIAGTGHQGFGGDGGAATKAVFRTPDGVAVDAEGNVYVADGNNNRVRRIDASGTVSTIAGTGLQGASGDGGPATEAQLFNPSGIALDGNGNILVASSLGHCVRKIDGAGIITTIAGTGEEGSSGDGGPAIEAQLNRPNAIAVDGEGNVYVAEYGSHRVRKIDTAGIITAFAGTGVRGHGGDGGPATDAKLDFVRGLAVDSAGNVYLTDINQARVRRVDRGGTIGTVVGTGTRGWSGDDGPATQARIATPAGIAVDSEGSLFLTEFWAGRIRKVDPDGIITTIAGTGRKESTGDMGLAVEASLDRPSGIAIDTMGNLYVTEAYGHRVRKLRAVGSKDGTR